ncbi:MAG: PorP/SprF family type IX secretion system membrane protein [Cecembia sp.]
MVFFTLMFSLNLDNMAQTRKYFGQFNQVQSYFNPALTGYEGSVVRGLVRNQWTGFDNAPQTYFLSAELDPMEISYAQDAALMGNTAVGLHLIQDNFGPFRQTELLLSYGARVRITNTTNLRLGVAANYNNIRLDGNNLTTEQINDPTVNAFLNEFATMEALDFNAGIAVTNQNYYIGYGLQNAARGRLTRGDVFINERPFVSVFNTGFRQSLNPSLTIMTNIMYRFQNDLPYNLDLNLKLLALEQFWVGIGHRVNYANSYQVGFLISNIRFGYALELPVSKSYLIPNPTHEFMISYFLFKKAGINNDSSNMFW